jgi:pimeloyl-ACP methyl ester carboxylesterase
MGGYARDIVACAREMDGPSLLLGHSLAGFAISLAAEKQQTLFTRLIYLTAAVPKLGSSSLRDAAPPDKSPSDMKMRLTASIPPEVAKAEFYNCCTKDVQEQAAAMLSPQPILPLLGKVRSTAANLGTVEKHSILCSQDRMMPIDYALANANQKFHSVQTLDTDHSPFLSQPPALVEAIERIAAAGSI